MGIDKTVAHRLVYTDGSCLNNGRPDATGGIVCMALAVVQEQSQLGTMELFEKLYVFTGSQYVLMGARRSDRMHAYNTKLWDMFHILMDSFQDWGCLVTIAKVTAHQGIRGNDEADRIARTYNTRGQRPVWIQVLNNRLLHVVIGLIASTSSVRAIEQTSISDVSLAENTHGLSAGVVDPLLTSGGNCPSEGRNCDNDSCSQYGWCGASDATETTSVSHLATRGLSPTCQPLINPLMNNGTSFLNAISYILYDPSGPGPTTMGCYCSDDGTNTICVTSRSQFHYTSVQDFVSAIGNPTISLQLDSYCWKCNRTAPVIEAVASAFSVSVYPSAIAAGIQPPAPANGVSHSPSSYSITATIGAICAIILFMYGV
ncbi:hypothetical protein BDV3_004743 [Batrachochytrium dendrobatidis]